MITIEVLSSIYSIDPIRTIEVPTLADARELMFAPDNAQVPMEVNANGAVVRNFPNVYTGTVASRERAVALWKAGDPDWIMHDCSY